MEVTEECCALAALPQGRCPQYPLNRRLHEPQSWCESFGEEKSLLSFLSLWQNYGLVVYLVSDLVS